MPTEFSSSPLEPDDGLTSEDIRLVIARLCAASEPPPLPDPTTTQRMLMFDAISEATGASHGEIEKALIAAREEQREARIRETLNELEEPLYRVERPATGSPEPVLSRISTRQYAVSSILDSLPKPDSLRVLHVKIKRETTTPGQLATMIVVYVMMFVAVLAVLIAIVKGMAGPT